MRRFAPPSTQDEGRPDDYVRGQDRALREQHARLARLLAAEGGWANIGEELLWREAVAQCAGQLYQATVAGRNRRRRVLNHAVERMGR